MRRTFIILAIIVILLGGAAAYFLFFASAPGVTVTPSGSSGLPTAGNATSTGTTGTSSSGSGFAISTSSATSVPSNPVALSARLVKISAGPVVPGEVITDGSSTSATGGAQPVTVHYLEQESGNVYAYSSDTGQSTRTGNKTVPGIEDATWLPDASLAFVRYLSGSDFSTINTYGLPADGSNGFFLSQDLAGLAISSSGSSLLALASGVNGSVASLEHADGTHATQAFSTPLTTVRASFAGKSHDLVFTKPTATLPGYAFLVNSAGAFSRIAGPLDGLVALASPDGSEVLVSYSASGTLHMELVDTKTGTVTQLPVATIADKCVWAADSSAAYCGIPQNPPATAQYPDDWYQGVVHFSDRIWKIDVTGRFAQLVLDFPREASGTLDAIAPAIDPAGTALSFVNKNDGSLWLYRL